MAQISDKLAVYTLGHRGVIIDQNPLEPSVPDDSLRLAQNAMHDPTMGYSGGIRKRPGLQRFNSIYAGGVILGGIPMPVAGTGGAPSSGGGIIGTGDSGFDGGITGDSSGTGDMTGAPGGTFDGGAAATTPAGSAIFGGGSLFGGKRLFVVGRLGSDATVGQEGVSGWYVSSKALADVATVRIPPGPALAPYSFPPAGPFDGTWGTPSCIDNIGTTGLYYASAYGDQTLGIGAGATRTVGTGVMGLGIRRTNGGTDTLVATIAANPSVGTGVDNPNRGVTAPTILASGALYVVGDVMTVVGGTGTAATMRVDAIGGGGVITAVSMISTGAYSVLPGNPFTTTGGGGSGSSAFNYTATATARAAIMFLHYGSDGFIYVGTKDKYAGQPTAGSFGRVIRLSPLDGSLTEWNMGQAGEGVGQDGIAGHTPMFFTHVPYCGCYFDGYLYVGTFPDAVNEIASLRATDGSFAGTGRSFVGSGATAYAMHSCMAVFNGRLFLGTGVWETTPTFAGVWSRQPGTAAPGLDEWTETFRATGGAAQNGNYFPSMVVFGDSLYISYYNPGVVGKIYKVAATSTDPLSSSFTVTTAATLDNNPYYLFVDDGVLYAIGTTGISGESAFVTTDGTTWTDKSASLPAGATASRTRPIFFGMAQ